jgi:hypothetical protein
VDGGGAPLGPLNEARRFHLSVDIPTMNPIDYAPIECTGRDLIPPCPTYTVASSMLATTPNYIPDPSFVETNSSQAGDLDLGNLHVVTDRFYTASQNWVLAFQAAPSIASTV